MLNSIVENKKVNRLYNDVDYLFKEFYAKQNNIKDFIEIAKDIDVISNKWNIRYRHLSILGDPAQHAVNVAILNSKIGAYFKVDKTFELILGGLLHDIGKFYIPDSIRCKPGKLTDNERVEMAKHPDIGVELLQGKIDNENVLDIIRNHHLTINSLPCPICINDVTIDNSVALPLICGVSDITDAMLSYRVYKEPLSIQETKYELISKGVRNVDKILEFIL